MEKREKPWNRVFHIVEKENCVYNKSLWIFVKEKNVRIWIGYRKRHIREQRNKEWSRAMVRWSADDIIYEDEQILVCRKHSGMAVQSARVGQMDLESELRNYRNGNYIGIVQRLDQPVEGGLVFGKIMCKLTGGKVNPLIGSAGVSAVPMAARVSQKEGQRENPSNFLLMHAMGPNVSGVIGSAVAAGIMLTLLK